MIKGRICRNCESLEIDEKFLDFSEYSSSGEGIYICRQCFSEGVIRGAASQVKDGEQAPQQITAPDQLQPTNSNQSETQSGL